MRINFTVSGLTCDGGSRVVCELANLLVANNQSVSITSMTTPFLTWMDHSPLNRKISVKVTEPSLFMRAFRKAYLTKRGWNYNVKEVLGRATPDCDVNIAAQSLLMYPVILSGKGRPVHLVQAYEPDTMYSKDEYFKRESEFAYTLPMKKICVSEHLAKKVNGINIGNGIDLNFYKPLAIERAKQSVMGINTRPYLPWKNGVTLTKVFSELRHHSYNILSPPRGTPDTIFLRYYNRGKTYIFLKLEKLRGLRITTSRSNGVWNTCNNFTISILRASLRKRLCASLKLYRIRCCSCNRRVKPQQGTSLQTY